MKKKMKIQAARIKRHIPAAAEYLLMAALIGLFCCFADGRAAASPGCGNGVIVVDAGHGGVDGGTNRGPLLEKDITLSLALKLKTVLERDGCTVILTRDSDVSLDSLDHSSSSRHKKDLRSRVGIINTAGADLFLSIHVNSLADAPSESGSIVFYGRKFQQSKTLASYIQEALNSIIVDGKRRKPQKPLPNSFYLLSYTEIPGVIVETAFISNRRERELLMTDTFQDQLAEALAAGTTQYLKSE